MDIVLPENIAPSLLSDPEEKRMLFNAMEENLKQIKKLTMQNFVISVKELFDDKSFSKVEKLAFNLKAGYDDQGLDIHNFYVIPKIKNQPWNPKSNYDGVWMDSLEGQVQNFLDTRQLPFIRDCLLESEWNFPNNFVEIGRKTFSNDAKLLLRYDNREELGLFLYDFIAKKDSNQLSLSLPEPKNELKIKTNKI